METLQQKKRRKNNNAPKQAKQTMEKNIAVSVYCYSFDMYFESYTISVAKFSLYILFDKFISFYYFKGFINFVIKVLLKTFSVRWS